VSRLIDACGCTCGSADEQLAPDRGTSILEEHGAITPVMPVQRSAVKCWHGVPKQIGMCETAVNRSLRVPQNFRSEKDPC